MLEILLQITPFSIIYLTTYYVQTSYLTISHTESLFLAIADYLREEIHFTSLKDTRL